MLAVPGSGKTTTMVSRVGYMIYGLGIEPEKILNITYTVASSKDMKHRYISLFGREYSDKVKFQTINAFCQGVIYYFERSLGRKAFELVSSNSDIISEVYRNVQNDFPTEYDIKSLQSDISYIKNMQLTEDEIKELNGRNYDLLEIYNSYDKLMRSRGLMDFDDQLVYSYRIMKQYPEILQYFQKRYSYVLVDEAQDTSKIQHMIIELLASAMEGAIFMVGDEDQSIYGFRAAYPEALLKFQENHENARVIYLEQNFRSTPQIVSKANNFIKLNKDRKLKNMFTENSGGKGVLLIKMPKRSMQYKDLTDKTKEWNDGLSTVILYRNNDSVLPLIHYFKKQGISYNLRGLDLTFFSAPQVQLTMDIMELAENPSNVDLFMKIYYKLGAYISKTEAIQVENYVRRNPGMSVFDALLDINSISKNFSNNSHKWNSKSSRKESTLRKLSENMDEIKSGTAWDAISIIRFAFNYYNDDERMFILTNVVTCGDSKKKYKAHLKELRSIIETGSTEHEKGITFSTVHSAKGLEWERVVIIDAVSGVFNKDIKDVGYKNAEKEEDRRLLYVAATRAKKELIIYSYSDYETPFVTAFMGKTPVSQSFMKVGITAQKKK